MDKQAELEHLNENLTFYRAVIDTMQEGVIVQDTTGQIVMNNPAAERILGLTAEQMRGRSVVETQWSIVDENGAPLTRDEHPALMALRTGQPQPPITVGLYKPDGTRMWVEVNCQPLCREGEAYPYGVVSTFIDLTQRRQHESRIRWLAKFPAENPNPVMRVATDGTIIYANASSAALLSTWSTDIGQPLPPEPYAKFSAALEAEASQSLEINVGTRVLALTFSPDDERQYVNIYGLEITQHRQTEEALRESERNMRMLLVAAPIGVVVVDHHGQIVLVNDSAERLFGYTHDELTGQPLELLVPGDIRPAHARHHTHYISNPRIRPMGNGLHLSAQHKNGRVFPVEINLGFVENEHGVLTMAFVIDMTRQRELETLREAMIRTMVHDLRNPLGAIYTGIAFLQEDSTPDADKNHRYVLDIALRNAEKMLALINNILEVSQLESGQLPLQQTRFPLRDLVSEVTSSLASLAETKGQRLHNDVPVTLPDTMADAKLIGRVLQNLIGNAIKFTPEGGTIAVTASHEDDGRVHVSVADTGPGISPEIRGKLFQQFVTGKNKERGNGLGLAFCKLAVEAHGESIAVESQLGEGTTFAFTLRPAAEEPEVIATP